MASPLGSQFDPHLFAEAARPQVSSHSFEDKLCRGDKGGLDLPVSEPACCQFILSGCSTCPRAFSSCQTLLRPWGGRHGPHPHSLVGDPTVEGGRACGQSHGVSSMCPAFSFVALTWPQLLLFPLFTYFTNIYWVPTMCQDQC